MSDLLEDLRRIKDNRGLMADLRCTLINGKKHRAWPALHRINVRIQDEIKALIAGLFATHPEETANGSFGITCKQLEALRSGGAKADDKVTPTERRFQHLIAAEPGEELFSRITRMVLMAKSQGIPVNYEQLLQDLEPRRWRYVRRKWASDFWNSNTETEDGGRS